MKAINSWIPRSLLAALLCCLPAHQQAQIILFGGGGSASGSTSTSYRGQASAVSGYVMGGAVAVANTGAIAASGGAQEAAVLSANVAGGFSAGVSHAATIAGGSSCSSEASVADLSFTGCGGFFFAATTITADFVMSHAAAVCSTAGAVVAGRVQVTGLVINGQAIAVTGQANQMVILNTGGWVIINEQVVGSSSITVNALHLIVPCASVDVVIGTSSAAITCGTQSPPTPGGTPTSQPCHFVTGGGWITGTPSGAKANFGVAGGIKNGGFWGHLNYKDHGNGMHVKATSVTGYQVDPTDDDCRIIHYNVTIDGQAGTARVRVCDKGEPGRNDIFEIQLSNGYSAGGDLGGNRPGGGNIQLHQCHD